MFDRILFRAQKAFFRRFSPTASAHYGEDQLEQLLQDSKIEAVVIVLPVQVMLKVTNGCYVFYFLELEPIITLALELQVALQALRAGKHVLQEKPAANSVDAVNVAIKEYGTNLKPALDNQLPVWALAENYRLASKNAKPVLNIQMLKSQSGCKA